MIKQLLEQFIEVVDNMETKDDLKLKGTYHFVHKDIKGNIKEEWDIDNLITNTGIAEIINLSGNVSSPVAFTYIALGSGTTSPAASQTALVTEISSNGFSRATATVSRVTTTITNDTLQLLKTFTASGLQTIEEVGIFNNSSSGIMLSRALTGSKSMVSGETLTVTYKLKLS